MHFRDARPDDQHQVQALVAAVLAEYGLRFDLTSTDADLVDLAASYPPGRAAFIVLEQAGRIVGTGAFAPWDELTCEIKKMYLRRSVRGRGWGRRLLVELERRARAAGYRRAWLETNSVLVEACRLYETSGYVRTDEGQCCPRCDRKYIKMLGD